MKNLFLWCFRIGLTLCYLPLRLLRAQNKVVFLSRQSDQPSLDFVMLSMELYRQDMAVQQVMLCKTIGKGLAAKVSYGFHLFLQMYHLATAKAAVVDGYCIPACLLPHKKSLKIYQLWHALGLLKNFGYAALGAKEGSSHATAKIMRMHRGYHKILCSSPAIAEDIAKCYAAPADKMLPLGLPRVDYLSDPLEQEKARRMVQAALPPGLPEKPLILYVPTFRKGGEPATGELMAGLDLTRFHLIVREHDGRCMLVTEKEGFRVPDQWTGLEFLAAADFVVTDYSAILFEAMVAGKPVVLYCYDREDYDGARGFATDYDAIPAPHCVTAQQVREAIAGYPQGFDQPGDFLTHHVNPLHRPCTPAIARTILEEMKISQKLK